MSSESREAFDTTAVEVFVAAEQINNRVVLTCDHASGHLPHPWKWSERDRWLTATHWSYDLGAAELTRLTATQLGCVAALARFTRLLVDPNRELGHETLFRRSAEGHEIALNQEIDSEEATQRVELYYNPYHEAIHQLVERSPGAGLLSVHTFTPYYDDDQRPMEIGVLFNDHQERAEEMARVFTGAGFRVAMNEPYSGYEGLMYGIERHGVLHERPYLEIEVRQDLAADAQLRPKIARVLAEATRRTLVGEAR